MIEVFRSNVCFAVLLTLFLLLTAGCTTSTSTAHTKQEIVVYAAASLTESMEAAKALYESEHPEVDLVFNFAGSQVLTNQILSGGQPDMFFSANEKYVDDLIVADIDVLTRLSYQPVKDIFAKNQLVLLADESLELTSLTDVFDLLKGNGASEVSNKLPSIEIVIASEEVPVGRYTKEFLEAYLKHTGDNIGYGAFVESIVSYESNVKNVLAKSKLHEADLVVVYQTDAKSTDLEAEHLVEISIPQEMNQSASYGSIAMSEEPEAVVFYTYMTSGNGQQILTQYGFEIGE